MKDEGRSRFAVLKNVQTVTRVLGFSLLFSWHFCLWFSPSAVPFIALLSRDVTDAWLVYLAATSLTLLLMALCSGLVKRPFNKRGAIVACYGILAISTLVFSLAPVFLSRTVMIVVIPVVMGISEAFCWIFQGESLARSRSMDDVTVVTAAAAATLFFLLLLTSLLPGFLAPLFVTLLPVTSGFLLIRSQKIEQMEPVPILKPRSVRKRASRNIFIVGAIAMAVSVACYYLLAVIPLDSLIGGDWAYFGGMMFGALALAAVSLFCCIKKPTQAFNALPWLLMVLILAFIIFLGSGHHLDGYAFFLATSVYTAFELLLMLYFVALTQKGWASVAVAFGVCFGMFRIGVLTGDSLALFVEGSAMLSFDLMEQVGVIVVAFVVLLFIPLMREGSFLEKLANKRAVTDSALARACEATAVEFGLSRRESEVLLLLMQGYSSNSIASDLVISPHTAQTHIQHIYAKTSVHSREELFNYVKGQAFV